MNILNISAYKFVNIPKEDLIDLKMSLKNKGTALDLKGTILLSTEGINQCVAGQADDIASFKEFLGAMPAFADLFYKESWSKIQPFDKMLVKIKPEIITFKESNIAPEKFTAPRIAPEVLKEWYAQKLDIVVLDTRNDYETRIGKFANAIDLNLQNFRDFPQVAQQQLAGLKDKTIVTYCTGGIRCEKAAAWMLQAGFKEVYQLDGGILNYFEKCGGEFYEGECFVFDNRIAIDAQLVEQNVPLCVQCQNPLNIAERSSGAANCSQCEGC
jgi:UPF0176 protein